MTHDGLKAYLVRHNGSNMVITTSRRESAESEFPAPTTDPALAAIAESDWPDWKIYLYPTSDDLALFYRVNNFYISGRNSLNEPFSTGTEVYVDGALLYGHRAMLSPDSLTLYWSGPTSRPLRAATRTAYNWFVDEREATTFELTDFAISADQLTLYYSDFPYPDIFVSTRTSKDDPFDVGVPVANVNTSDGDVPMNVSADGCLLYIRSNRPGADGANDFWVARRGH